ncbi:MAG: glycosyltransferase family 9 protein [Ignavibacteriaceae bacterium]
MSEYISEKILVIQTAFIGDAILTLPMVQVLKRKFPESEIHVLCIPSAEEIFKASPFVNEVKVLDKKNKHKSLISLYKFSKKIRREKYTRIYSPHRSFRTALLIMLSGVRETFGFSNSSLNHVYKNLVEYNSAHHEVQRNLDLIGYNYSANEWKIIPELKILSDIKNKIDNYIRNSGLNNQFISIAPGSVWNTKIYPSEYYEEVIKFIINNTQYNVLLIGGERDGILCSDISSKFSGKVYSAAGKFDIIESIEILRRAELLITNDSAPTHMAMCADIPAITLYCSTTSKLGFYPYNNKSSFLSYDDLFCKPCGIHGYIKCPINTFECGYNLKPEIVVKKIEEMLNVQRKDRKIY